MASTLSVTGMPDPRIWIDHRVRDDILDDIRGQRRCLETGGPLIGYIAGDAYVVVRAPGVPVANRHRASFQPSYDAVDEIIASEHRRSDGQLRYLGSWHSHPSGTAVPSSTDHNTAKNIASEPEVKLARPLQLIAATSVRPWRAHVQDLGCWQWDPRKHALTSRSIIWMWTDLRGSHPHTVPGS